MNKVLGGLTGLMFLLTLGVFVSVFMVSLWDNPIYILPLILSYLVYLALGKYWVSPLKEKLDSYSFFDEERDSAFEAHLDADIASVFISVGLFFSLAIYMGLNGY